MIIWLVCQLLCAGIVIPGILKAVSGTDTALTAFQEQPGAFPSAALWINFSGAMLLFLLPALVFAIVLSQEPLAFVGLKKTTLKLLPWAVLAGIAMIFVLPGISEWLQYIGFGNQANELQQQREEMEAIYFRDRSTTGLLRNIFLLAMVPAFCEEFFFRGVLQRLAFTLTSRKWIAIFATAILFGLVHNSIYNFLPIFIAGLILGYVYFETGSLWINIALHFIYNMAQIIAVHFSKPGQELVTDTIQVKILIASGAVLIIALSLKMIHKYGNPISLGQRKADQTTSISNSF